MRIQWSSGMRFKMAFETEDSSRISWFMGTIACAQVADPIRWPNSLWRLLQVTWDEPDMLQNVKRVSPWLVEMVSNIPAIHLSPFSPPRKKLRLPHHPDFPLDGQFPMPSFTGNPFGPSSPLCCLSDDITAGIQGARHAQIRVPLSDHLSNKLQLGLLPPSFLRLDPHAKISDGIVRSHNRNEDISCLLSMGNSNQKSEKTNNFLKYYQERILQDFQKVCPVPRFCQNRAFMQLRLDWALGTAKYSWSRRTWVGFSNYPFLDHTKIYTKCLGTFGEEPFSEFTKTAKRLTILMKPGTSNVERKLITGLPTAERGLDSSNQTGPLGIFA
ncbi:Auxin response factor 10 [Forsythia ovata]|uniref:Auxin response factor 10 n=1 Tax=Forsythia ovata TaxID=205694 RepID=A0ABD1T485_9LAMI